MGSRSLIHCTTIKKWMKFLKLFCISLLLDLMSTDSPIIDSSNSLPNSNRKHKPVVTMKQKPSLSVNLPADDGKYITVDKTFVVKSAPEDIPRNLTGYSLNNTKNGFEDTNHQATTTELLPLPDPESPDYWMIQIENWKRLVVSGNGVAAQNIGVALYKGEIGVPKNEVEAVKYFTIAAEAGISNSMFNLGWAYASGSGTIQSWSKALHWWKKAAEAGNGSAARNLGLLYGLGIIEDENNKGIQDDVIAFQYYHLSAQLKNIKGIVAVINCYSNGVGVLKDPELAQFWQNRLDSFPEEMKSSLRLQGGDQAKIMDEGGEKPTQNSSQSSFYRTNIHEFPIKGTNIVSHYYGNLR